MSTLPAPEAPSPAAGPTVVVRTVPLEAADPLLAYLPADVPHDELLSWVRRGEGLVGWGSALTFEAHGADRFREAEAWWREIGQHAVVRDEVERPGTGLVCFGSFPFAVGLGRGGAPRRAVDHRRPPRRPAPGSPPSHSTRS